LLGSGSFQGRDALFDCCGLGLDVLQIGFTGLRLGSEFAQIGLQASDALRTADEPPVEARSVLLMVPVVFVLPVMLTVPALAAATAGGLAASAVAAARLLLALAVTATGAGCFLVMAAVAVAMTSMLLVAAATFMPTMASALSAHCLHSPVLI
jgi:hypothetical protein